MIQNGRLAHRIAQTGIALAAISLIAACGGSSDPAPIPEETRAQDAKTFAFADGVATATTFNAMAADPGAGDAAVVVGTRRWAGVLGGAAYHVEVPANWNGKLVMYAHGYAGGDGTKLNVSDPLLRRHLIQGGYAWAASSYSKNNYDVRAGVEDTNALANEFVKIAAKNGVTLAAPTKTYITGVSMGGHITAAAIEDETQATANNKVKYNGAVPMCGVVGDTELFNQFAEMQLSAQALAGLPAYATDKFADINTAVTNKLFATFPSKTAGPEGDEFVSVLQNITGGQRPMFAQGMAFGGVFGYAWGVFGSDGTVTGILNKNILDTNGVTYTVDGNSAATTALNKIVLKLTAATDANRLRTDGLRWIPKANGEFKIPVVSIHTLGDLYVPFSMEQVYQKRVAAKGNSSWLVQRAIRGASHCDFTAAEEAAAFDDMVAWESGGAKPAGDDVVTPATVAAPTYGCTYTKNAVGVDDSASTKALRQGILGSGGACPA